jgi:hypothetical protein
LELREEESLVRGEHALSFNIRGAIRPFQENKSPKTGGFLRKKYPVWEALISGTALTPLGLS